MTLDISDRERDLLLEMLAARHAAMYHELHHTDIRDYKEYVRQKMTLLEGLKAKVEVAA